LCAAARGWICLRGSGCAMRARTRTSTMSRGYQRPGTLRRSSNSIVRLHHTDTPFPAALICLLGFFLLFGPRSRSIMLFIFQGATTFLLCCITAVIHTLTVSRSCYAHLYTSVFSGSISPSHWFDRRGS